MNYDTESNEVYPVTDATGLTGRFLEEDTYLGDGRNLYVYVKNNPLSFIDPSGYAACESGRSQKSVWSGLNQFIEGLIHKKASPSDMSSGFRGVSRGDAFF